MTNRNILLLSLICLYLKLTRSKFHKENARIGNKFAKLCNQKSFVFIIFSPKLPEKTCFFTHLPAFDHDRCQNG